MTRTFRVGPVHTSGTTPLFILGPCVIESESFIWTMAEELSAIAQSLEISWIFKASYDKANRTSAKSYRGFGIDEGCKLLKAVSDQFKVPVTTDIHSPEEAKRAAEFVDLL